MIAARNQAANACAELASRAHAYEEAIRAGAWFVAGDYVDASRGWRILERLEIVVRNARVYALRAQGRVAYL